MELSILNESLQRTSFVNEWMSLIWTERYADAGDFSIVMAPEDVNPELYIPGTLLSLSESVRVMRVDKVETKTEDSGEKKVVISGYSLEALLKERMNQPIDIFEVDPTGAPGVLGGTPLEPVLLEGLPADINRELFYDICKDNTINTNDNIPDVNEWGTIIDPTRIQEPTETVSIRAEVATLFDTIKNISDVYRLGFAIIRVDEEGHLYFVVYTGYDRTTSQNDRDPLIFDQNLDNLSKVNEIKSAENYKNVAYVFAKNGSHIVYEDSAAELAEGVSRRVLMVNATDIELPFGSDLISALEQRGKEELAKNNVVYGFDGEVSSNELTYGFDLTGSGIAGYSYGLGDLVEQRSPGGIVNYLRLTEYMFSSDGEGEKRFPTFTIETTLSPDTWAAQPPTKVWDSLGDTPEWDTF